jgi:hypothetical protein
MPILLRGEYDKRWLLNFDKKIDMISKVINKVEEDNEN